MNPLRIRAANYASFPDLDLDLPQGCIAVLGENGAGKSSLVNAIDLAIFGAESRSLADHHSDQAAPGDVLLLELELEHAGVLYRIRRTYSARGRGKATLDFERSSNGSVWDSNKTTPEIREWDPLARASAKETQELIEQTLGLSRETFRASAFLAQDDGAAFTEAAPRDRKRILAQILDLARYDVLLKQARTEKQSVEVELQQLAGRAAETAAAAEQFPSLEKSHASLVEAETVTADELADLERTHADLGAEYQAAREHAARRAAAAAELREAEAAVKQLDEQIQRGADATQQISVARDELAALTTPAQLEELLVTETALQALEQGYRDALAKQDVTVARAREATSRRADLLARATAAKTSAGTRMQDADEILAHVGEAKCDRCEQVLGEQAALRAAASLRSDAAELTLEANDLEAQAAAIEVPAVPDDPEPPLVEGDTVANDLTRLSSLISGARNDQAQRARLEERVRSCEAVLEQQPTDDAVAAARAAVDDKTRALATVGEPPDLSAIAARGTHVAERVKDARRRLDAHRTERARVEERLRIARAAAAAAAELAKTAKALRDDLEVLVELERAFSPNGIPALIVENSAVPYLETEANRILQALGTAFIVELRTQAALKSGDGLRDTLDVIVCGDRGDRPYETFSGGERTRINLALRIALARLLAHRRGAESRLLAIDEPEFLDEKGTAALVDVLRDLDRDFDRIYLISHVPALRDAFDQVLTVTKDETGSRIVVGYEAAVEAVVA